ncbi:MAG TPA: response regulator [Leptolyngbyaceae cyanobacterium M33_DOE_097]|nr:response regulator [Leptolyngbyaceae cyanobacterium M33_DOE_097]
MTEIESLTTRSQSQHILQLAPDQPVYRILVAEDNDTNRQLLVQLLQAVGFIVQSAINGQEAIAQWESWQPHLIWMDMRMPVMNGYEATQQIRAKEQERNYQSRHADPSAARAAVPSAQAPTFIIALTANAFEEERARVLEAGCNDFIRKPFQETELLEKMAAYLGVEYLYVSPHQAEATAIAPSDGMNEIAALRSLPSSLLAQMLQATMQIDYQRLTTLLEEVASTQPDVAALLTKKLDDFDFEGILQLLEKANPTLP